MSFYLFALHTRCVRWLLSACSWDSTCISAFGIKFGERTDLTQLVSASLSFETNMCVENLFCRRIVATKKCFQHCRRRSSLLESYMCHEILGSRLFKWPFFRCPKFLFFCLFFFPCSWSCSYFIMPTSNNDNIISI